MDINFFKKIRILDGGTGQELLARGMKPKGTLWSASALLDQNYHNLLLNTHLDFIKAGADVIVNPQYEIKATNFFLFSTVEASVTGMKGTFKLK